MKIYNLFFQQVINNYYMNSQFDYKSISFMIIGPIRGSLAVF